MFASATFISEVWNWTSIFYFSTSACMAASFWRNWTHLLPRPRVFLSSSMYMDEHEFLKPIPTQAAIAPGNRPKQTPSGNTILTTCVYPTSTMKVVSTRTSGGRLCLSERCLRPTERQTLNHQLTCMTEPFQWCWTTYYVHGVFQGLLTRNCLVLTSSGSSTPNLS